MASSNTNPVLRQEDLSPRDIRDVLLSHEALLRNIDANITLLPTQIKSVAGRVLEIETFTKDCPTACPYRNGEITPVEGIHGLTFDTSDNPDDNTEEEPAGAPKQVHKTIG